VIVIIFRSLYTLAGVRSQTQMSQRPASLTVTEGGTATLHCNYTANNFYSLQWYRQKPNASPEKVLILTTDKIEEDKQFRGSLDTGKRIGVLNVSSSQAEDSATYYCAVQAQEIHWYSMSWLQGFDMIYMTPDLKPENSDSFPGMSYGDKVYPWMDFQTSEETQETRIYCNYSLTSTANEYLYWYQQRPGGNPRYILYRIGSNNEDFRSEEFDGRFTGYLNTSAKFTYLSISRTQLSDSALYYCALKPTV
uniref:Ig-like domain-containing protein n=1 Tax=Lepisosteus oculatus TaxID=7918 RepID=W5MG01_LEPOC